MNSFTALNSNGEKFTVIPESRDILVTYEYEMTESDPVFVLINGFSYSTDYGLNNVKQFMSHLGYELSSSYDVIEDDIGCKYAAMLFKLKAI